MKKVFILFLLMFLSMPAFAAKWVDVNKTTKMDIDSILMTDEQCCDVLIHVTKTNYNKNDFSKKAEYARALVSINLFTHQAMLKNLYEYDKKNKIISKEKTTEYEYFTPDSYIADVERKINQIVDFLIKRTADEWVEITDKVYLNTPTWQAKNGYQDIWLKVLNDNDIKPINNKKVLFQMQHMQVDCSKRQLKLLSVIYYDLKSEPIETVKNNTENESDVVPSTRGYALFKYVCKP